MTDFSDEDLDGLLALQQTDLRVRRLRHQLDELPEQQRLDDTVAESDQVAAAYGDVRVELDKVSAEVRQLEGEVELLRTRRDDEQSRMYSGEISNPRELQGLRAEVDSTQRRIGDHEDELLDVMERQDALQSRADALSSERERLQAAVTELSEARDEAAQGLLAELAELEAGRDGERGTLPAELLERYDDAAGRTRGAAVGELRDGMCTACRIELPVVEYQQLLTGPPLATCPQCRRLVVIR